MNIINNCLIIGLGNIGFLYDLNSRSNTFLSHTNSINKSKFFSLYGVVDIDPKIRKICKKNLDTKVFSNINELKKKKFDLIIISTPTNTHYKIMRQILVNFKPKVILAEKPLTSNFNQIKKINQLAKKKKIKIFVNYSRISDISSEILKKKLVNAPYSFCKVFYSKSILNNGSHFVNLFQYFFGKILNYELFSNQKEKFLLKFNNAEVLFKRKESKKTNSFLIKNKKFIIDYRLSSNQIRLKNKKKTIISSYNRNLNYYVIKNLENFLKKKKFKLCSLNDAMETHKILHLLKKGIKI